jgi:hypothetical protein
MRCTLVDQLSQSTDQPSVSPQPDTDEIPNDLISALECVMARYSKPASVLLLEAVQMKIARIQHRTARRLGGVR